MAETPDEEIVFKTQPSLPDAPRLGQGNVSVEEDDPDVYSDASDAGQIMETTGAHRVNETGERRTSKTVQMRPETFSGSEDWEAYISHFEICAELGSWGERCRMLTLAASLRGSARGFYLNLSSREKGTYASLVKELSHRFGSTRQHGRWMTKLEGRRRKADESIAELGDDLRQMAQRAYPEFDAKAQEALALNQLYKTIGLEIKCRCLDRDCRTVSQAVDVIERYETMLGDGMEKKRSVRMVNTQSGYGQVETRKTDGIDKVLKDVIDRLERIEKRNDDDRRTSVRCSECNRTGHYARHCPERQRQNRETKYPRNQNQGNSKPPSQ
ncbi:hypothetical protein SNE40_009807 [Patella caerulea]|uniref:CCHC-type domain-containing protein n=1 Tax=Patella caerulea TaxID=87958 RepID=A0AAN8Q3Q5_PATCE